MSPIDDPEILAFIADTEAAYPADTNGATAADNRRFYDAMCRVFRVARPAGVAVLDEIIGGVPVRVYRHAGTPAPVAAGGAAAVVYAHGGGFVVGSLESHDDVCAELCLATGTTVVAVDYRLAPEHRHPAQLDDVATVFAAVARAFATVAVAGDSAGATLVAGLCVRLARQGKPKPAGAVLIYPWLGGELDWPSYIDNAEAPMLRTSDLSFYSEARYGGSVPAGPLDEAMPLEATDFGIFPPSFVVTADVDPLRDDGSVFAARLTEAGVPATCRNEAQLVHGFLRARHRSARARVAFEAIGAALRDLLGARQT